MASVSMSPAEVRKRSLLALSRAFSSVRPEVPLDKNGYVATFDQNLIDGVLAADFETDVRRGNGNELAGKFRAAHSSSALAVNNFGPFKRHPLDLRLLGQGGFGVPLFERKCSTGVPKGNPPNLDAVVESEHAAIGIESKCTEFLQSHRAEFSPAYADGDRDATWFVEMMRLSLRPTAYSLLDAGQLIKHALGLAHTFSRQKVTLLYLFWEPSNPDEFPVFDQHRNEVFEFANRVRGGNPSFQAMSYPELWKSWESPAAAKWITDHNHRLKQRYALAI